MAVQCHYMAIRCHYIAVAVTWVNVSSMEYITNTKVHSSFCT